MFSRVYLRPISYIEIVRLYLNIKMRNVENSAGIDLEAMIFNVGRGRRSGKSLAVGESDPV